MRSQFANQVFYLSDGQFHLYPATSAEMPEDLVEGLIIPLVRGKGFGKAKECYVSFVDPNRELDFVSLFTFRECNDGAWEVTMNERFSNERSRTQLIGALSSTEMMRLLSQMNDNAKLINTQPMRRAAHVESEPHIYTLSDLCGEKPWPARDEARRQFIYFVKDLTGRDLAKFQLVNEKIRAYHTTYGDVSFGESGNILEASRNTVVFKRNVLDALEKLMPICNTHCTPQQYYVLCVACNYDNTRFHWWHQGTLVTDTPTENYNICNMVTPEDLRRSPKLQTPYGYRPVFDLRESCLWPTAKDLCTGDDICVGTLYIDGKPMVNYSAIE